MTNNITHTLQLVVLFCCCACLKLSAGTGRTVYLVHLMIFMEMWT